MAGTSWTAAGVWSGSTWANGDSATFTDTPNTVNIGSTISQTGITINPGDFLPLNRTATTRIQGTGTITGDITKTGGELWFEHSGGFNGTLTTTGDTRFDNLGATSASTKINLNNSFSKLYLGPAYISGTMTIGELVGAGSSEISSTGAAGLRTLKVDQASDTTFAGKVNGTSNIALEKDGVGKLEITGAGNFTGGTTVSGGTLKVGFKTALGSGAVAVESGAVLELGVVNEVTNAVSIAGSGIGGTGALRATASGTIGAQQLPSITLTDDATIGGTGSFYMIAGSYGTTTLALGTKTLTKVGANTFSPISTSITGTGTVDIQEGTFKLGDSSRGTSSNGTTTAFTLANVSGATLALGKDAAIGSLAGGGATGGSVTLNGSTLTIGGSNANTDFAGVISTSGNIVKNGTGTQAFSGVNTYSGTTTVSGGTLLVNGTHTGGAYTIDAGATLGGTGSIASGVTVNGTLAPGESPGTLDIGNTLSLGNNSTFQVEIGGNNPGDGTGFYDQANMTNASGSVSLGTGVTLNASLFGGFTPNVGDAFYILTRADAGTYGNDFNGLAEGATVNLGIATAKITYLADWTGSQGSSSLTGGNDVALSIVTVVPEPGSFAMLLFGSVMLLAVRRKRGR